jgi:hypothetical protein
MLRARRSSWGDAAKLALAVRKIVHSEQEMVSFLGPVGGRGWLIGATDRVSSEAATHNSLVQLLPMRVKISDVAVGDAQPPPGSEGRRIPLLQIYRMSTQTDRLLV